jgi:hypothetical protein
LFARSILLEAGVQLICSSAVVLELIPKATFRKNFDEVVFYENLLDAVYEWIPVDETLILRSIELASTYDIAGMDSIHIAAALAGQVDQFLTTENPSKPIYRATMVNPVFFGPEPFNGS